MMITDAQGNAIRTTETRANITFEFQKENGKTLKVIDSCVFGEVTQPLFVVRKTVEDWMGNGALQSRKSISRERQFEDSDNISKKLYYDRSENLSSGS